MSDTENISVSKTLVFMWHKKFQDGFTNLKYGPRPGQIITNVANGNTVTVAGLIKPDARLTVQGS